jgi:hypothetical protein
MDRQHKFYIQFLRLLGLQSFIVTLYYEYYDIPDIYMNHPVQYIVKLMYYLVASNAKDKNKQIISIIIKKINSPFS